MILPKAEIIGADPKYLVGDTVNVTCISTGSKPAASLTWKVNGVEVYRVTHLLGKNLGSNSSGSWWATTVAASCPGRMVKHPKSKSTGGFY